MIAASVAHAEVTIREHLSDDTLLTLGSYAFEGGRTLDLTVGIGSGAFRAGVIRPTRSGRSATAAPELHVRRG